MVVQINGIIRKKATKSKIVGQVLIGTDTSVIGGGTVFSVDGNPTSRFVMDDTVVFQGETRSKNWYADIEAKTINQNPIVGVPIETNEPTRLV